MNEERKIQPVVRKFSSFEEAEEAEEADDEYWANTTSEERITALIDLRKIFINNSYNKTKLQKIVVKRSVYEKTD